MKLSDILIIAQGKVIKDAEFDKINFCTANVDYTFLSFMENPKFLTKMSNKVTSVICTEELVKRLPDTVTGIFVSENPKYAFYQIHNYLSKMGKQTATTIDSTAQISARASISNYNVSIGAHTVIEDNVVIYPNVSIGDNVCIHANTILGGRSFDFAKSTNGEVIGWNDSGRVVIEDNVEICSSTHIAQGCLDDDITLLKKNSRIDALVYIGHGVHVGQRTFIAGGTIVGGNCRIGDDVWIGLNATVSNRMVIGNNARVSLGAVVTKNVANSEIVSGNFAIEHSRFLENLKNSLTEEMK